MGSRHFRAHRGPSLRREPLRPCRRPRGSAHTLLRKDFVVTDYQLWEGRAAGADLALLIVAALASTSSPASSPWARELGITCLVTPHDPKKPFGPWTPGAGLIGVNNRDLKTLEVDLSHFQDLAETIGDRAVKVAESGILSVDDAVRMRSAGPTPSWWGRCSSATVIHRQR